jgi:hypothetical protein
MLASGHLLPTAGCCIPEAVNHNEKAGAGGAWRTVPVINFVRYALCPLRAAYLSASCFL